MKMGKRSSLRGGYCGARVAPLDLGPPFLWVVYSIYDVREALLILDYGAFLLRCVCIIEGVEGDISLF